MTADNQIKRIILEGGGVKGVAFIGALKELQHHEDISKVKQIAGSSAGGIVALLFAIGYTFDEIEEIMKNINFSLLLDDSFGIFRDFRRLLKRYGFYKGSYLKKLIEKFISKKVGRKHYTFKDLYDNEGMELLLTGTNMNYRRVDYFHHSTTPDMPLSAAVRITMSIPYVFQSIQYNGCLYVDGGVLNNYPFDSFWKLEHKDEDISEEYINETIGMKVENQNEMKEHDGEVVYYNIGNIKEFTAQIVDTLLFTVEKNNTPASYLERTILIPTNVDSTNFDLTDEQKIELFDNGINAVCEFLGVESICNKEEEKEEEN